MVDKKKEYLDIIDFMGKVVEKQQGESKHFGPWQPHPMFEGNYTRVCTETGKTSIVLLPEGLGTSKCWVWIIYTAGDTFSGSNLDKEVARQQADNKAKELGYTLL